MPHVTPLVERSLLVQSEGEADRIEVGTSAWYGWLADATSFTFHSEHGSFTAAKERRGATREYWKAYRRHAGKLQRVYLGKSIELSLERLNAVAQELAGRVAGARADGEPARSNGGVLVERPQLAEPASATTLYLTMTKLNVPTPRQNLVPRPQLVGRLDAAIEQSQKLILIAAPAGFGKTTVLIEWLGRAAAPAVAWLALDDDDNHLGQFLAYMIAALGRARPGIGAEAAILLQAQAADPPAQAILTSLVNELATMPGQLVLALDDYHTISLQAVHEALAFFLDRMPPQIHVVLTTRADPPLPLARLRARGQLSEIRAADLRFTAAETTYLFDQTHHLALPPDALATLANRTEGWIAGLQLAALALHQHADEMPAFLADFNGSHHYVFEYLAEEVFQRQSETVRMFLMQTAILPRLCVSLCDAVTGQGDAQSMLEHLDQANVFLFRLDGGRQWYRYHHLFSDFLRERLDRFAGSAGRALLHRRASRWFEEHSLLCEAIDHALGAQAWDDALRCMAPLMASQHFYSYYLDWPRWVAALPESALSTHPDLCRRFAWILICTGHVEAADRPMDLAESVWQAVGNQEKVGELLGLRALALGTRGQLAHAIRAAQQAFALLPADAYDRQGVPAYVLGISDLYLGHIRTAMDWFVAASAITRSPSDPFADQQPSETFLSLGITTSLAYTYQQRGELQRAAQMYGDVRRRMGSAIHLQVPVVFIRIGTLHYEWNDLGPAEEFVRNGIALFQQTGRARYWPSVWGRLARILWACGDMVQAAAMAEQSLTVARALGNETDIVEAEVQQAWLWLAQGDLAAAERWLALRAIAAGTPLTYNEQSISLLQTRIGIARARQTSGSPQSGGAIGGLRQLLQLAMSDCRVGDQIVILLLLAQVSALHGDQQQAIQSIGDAIALAMPGGYLRTFVDEGMPIHELISAYRAQFVQPHPETGSGGERLLIYLDQLLAAFSPYATQARASAPATELLSERERAVLQLIAGGRSVQQIAEILVISSHTARSHIKNIYTKLDAHTRVEAVERARALQIL
jgi:LuxR family maltose regulon positive regulatory protein